MDNVTLLFWSNPRLIKKQEEHGRAELIFLGHRIYAETHSTAAFLFWRQNLSKHLAGHKMYQIVLDFLIYCLSLFYQRKERELISSDNNFNVQKRGLYTLTFLTKTKKFYSCDLQKYLHIDINLRYVNKQPWLCFKQCL